MATLVTPSAPDHSSHAARSDHPPVDPAAVHQVLEEVLTSPPFCHTQQCQNLLRYIIRHSLAQEDHLLRERVIGAEVFGRRPDYDTGEDPVVRIRAADLRKRLAQFYQSTVDAPNPPDVQIEIPSGSYRASFRWREGTRTSHEGEVHQPAHPLLHATDVISAAPIDALAAAPAVAPLPERYVLPAPSRSVVSTARLRWALLAVVAAVCVFLGYRTVVSAQQRDFRVFWQPWISSSKPVIISVGSNAVYRISEELTERYAREHKLEPYGEEFYIPTGPNSEIGGNDIHAAVNSFVALGDVNAVSTVAAAVTRQEHGFRLRFPEDISFAELRDTPSVLVGGFNNAMTVELTKNLPFVLRQRNQIQDNLTGRTWTLHTSDTSDSHSTEDYAIVTRLVQRNGDAPILSVAGLGQYGTIAAAQFICDPTSIAALARQIPRHWGDHNLQLVLHVSVVDFKPASTDIVAVHTW